MNKINILKIKKFFCAKWAIIFLIGLIILLKGSSIKNILFNFDIEEYRLIKDYLAILVSWPVAVTAITFTFILKFSESIEKFLENVGFLKFGPFEAR